jgi:hypothetical protein
MLVMSAFFYASNKLVLAKKIYHHLCFRVMLFILYRSGK